MKDTLFIKQYQALIEDEKNIISVLANTSAYLFQELSDVSWAGFYLFEQDKLVLGPFQGKVACTTIPMNKGVCGTSATQQKSILVEDVHAFPGHIACDSASNSELVVPIMRNNTLYGVLDLDSTSFHRFKEDDKIQLEAIVSILEKLLSKI